MCNYFLLGHTSYRQCSNFRPAVARGVAEPNLVEMMGVKPMSRTNSRFHCSQD